MRLLEMAEVVVEAAVGIVVVVVLGMLEYF